jgi:hypothetical protein
MHLLTLHSILEKELIPLGLIQCLGALELARTSS